MIDVPIPEKIQQAFFDESGLWKPSRYKVLEGGRGGAKSETLARLGIGKAREETTRILCTRLYQNSIEDSVHRTIADAITELNLGEEFEVQKRTIRHWRTGSDFIFKGTATSINEIKSLKGVKYCWIEEAEPFPKNDFEVIDPTLRVDDSEFWISYNPDEIEGYIHKRFVTNTDPDAIVVPIGWRDNPWFPSALSALRKAAKKKADEGDEGDKAAYDWIWEGKCRRITDAIVFRNRVVIEDFDEVPGVRLYYGADWGFADDPTVLVRCYMLNGSLYVTHASYGYHVEMDDIPQKIFSEVPDHDKWPIKGDIAQPMIISYLAGRRKYNITGAEKWPGSVEDGISFLKAFTRIVVHPRCKELIQEFRLYSWKVDPRQTDDKGNPVILPVLVDKWNHGIDGLRYALDGYIRGKGELNITPSGQASAPPPVKKALNVRRSR